MAHILIMPRQGNTVESCIITEWKVKEGDKVTAETTVCEVETDKATFEVPAGAEGTVLVILHGSGDDVPVLAPIAVIGATGEDWATALGNINYDTVQKEGEASPSSGQVAELPPLPGAAAPNRQLELDGTIAMSPRARNLAAKKALTVPGTFGGTGPGGRIIERDIKAALENRPALTAAARAAGGAIPAVGSGIGGRVTVSDLATGTGITPGITAHGADFGEGVITETAIKGIRKVISDRLLKSLAESAQFTLNASASVSRLQDIRSRMKTSEYFAGESGLSKITINDMILFAVSRILPRYPYMNAHKIGDTVRTFERVHLGLAVDTLRGLMVPVIRNANLLSLAQISAEAKRLAAACQNGSAKPDELSGSTFTVSTLGSLGITSFTPIINTPEVAILGVCNIEMKPVAHSPAETNKCNCGFCFEPHIGFSLTINHQVVDGAPAARFLKALCEAVSDIDLIIAAG
jgi:pyruvate dehydrogenase E2 component (dihydrolipoamide acetyltransferase)